MDGQKREFRGIWIPREIWFDTRLNALDKIILAEIDSLDDDQTGCFAGNEYLADFAQCSERKVSEAIGNLIKCGYIYVASFDGRKRTLRSRLATVADQGRKNCEADLQELQQINKENNKSYKGFTPPTLEEVKAYCAERGNKVDAERFIDFYTSKGWFVGKNKMKDWKAAVRTWEREDANKAPKKDDYLKHNYTKEQLDGVIRKLEDVDDDWGDDIPPKKKDDEYLKHDYTKEQLDGVVAKTEDYDEDWID